MAKTVRPRRPPPLTPEAVLEGALALAEAEGWADVRMMHVAAALKTPLARVHVHFRDMDAIADAWFAGALAAVGKPMPGGFARKSAEERLFLAIMRWLDALAAHRTVSADMIRGKLYLSHPHHWAPMAFSLSRLVHVLLDAALIDSRGRRRQAEEVGCTLLILAVLRVWRRDDSDGQERTRAFLRIRLARGNRMMARLFKRKPNAVSAASKPLLYDPFNRIRSDQT